MVRSCGAALGGGGLVPRVAAAVVAVVAVMLACGVQVARAQAPGACGSVLLAGGSWLGGSGVDVKSNGGDEGSGVSCGGTSVVNGVVAGSEWQCVELVNRLYLSRGWISSTWRGNGGRSSPSTPDSMYDEAPASFAKQPNGSIGYIGPGDVISINIYDGGAFVPDGHVLVANTSGNVTGGSVSLVSENSGDSSDATPVITATLSGGTLSIPGGGGWSYSVIGVVHAPSSTGPPALTESNLLVNGGFETGNTQGWSVMSGSAGDVVNFAAYSNSSAHDGGSYLEANSSVDGGSVYQDVPVNMQAGQSATFSMWVRLGPGNPASGQAVGLCLWSLNGLKNACEQKTLTSQWQQVQATATMPVATTDLRAQLYMYGRGNINFDGGSLGAPQTADAVYPPAATSPPSISGAPAVGASIACVGPAWSDNPTSVSFTWLRDGAPVPGATHSTYVVTSADLGHSLSCQLTAVNAAGSTTATSRPVSVPSSVGVSGLGGPGPSPVGASSSGSQSVAGCVVPRLLHMTLSAARRALAGAHCEVGKVSRPRHPRRGHVLRVVAQSARRTSHHSPNYRVNLTLR